MLKRWSPFLWKLDVRTDGSVIRSRSLIIDVRGIGPGMAFWGTLLFINRSLLYNNHMCLCSSIWLSGKGMIVYTFPSLDFHTWYASYRKKWGRRTTVRLKPEAMYNDSRLHTYSMDSVLFCPVCPLRRELSIDWEPLFPTGQNRHDTNPSKIRGWTIVFLLVLYVIYG